jgi:hypothetical protein
MKMLNSKKRNNVAEIIDYKEDKGLVIVKYRCPYCRFVHSIIEKSTPPYYKTCNKCKGRVLIKKPKE